MNTRFAWVLAAAVLAGCSNDWSAGLGLADDGQQQAAATAPDAASISPVNGVRPIGFASAPDRGDLLQYPAEPVVRRTGAYTWHATRLSEEHAMAAVVSGRMRITAPDGTPIALDYARHVEHPDGNWSWVGRNPDAPGQDAVITFGPEAVFGSVPQGNDLPPLRLTMADGAGWVVSADPRQLADIRNSATHPDGPDYLVPPKLTSASGASSGMAMAGAQPQAVTASAATTVDVLVGYTNGFASARGGTSAAATRVHNLVDITNQAYANSQVDARLRLVHSMQVTYADATDNGTALEELTGFKAPSTQTTPAPAFNALRAARDQYGADLVVLVRQFKDPENDGCGIAWLIGGGQSGISQSDEFFGYSVVSDGQDQGADGKTYFCREETFAHEVGHNMGSQHDEETAGDSYGAYDYSFGYKTSEAAGDFYTVMAYGDTGQTAYRVFSNPSVSLCGGRACGVANQADNARSLRQATPVIAQFRQSVAEDTTAFVKHDMDGDGKSDILWRYGGDIVGNFRIWTMGGSDRSDVWQTTLSSGYRVVATGDFNGDGIGDVVWRHPEVADLRLWLGKGDGRFDGYWVPSYNGNWDVVGAGDIDGDGKSDLLWRYKGDITGNFRYWIMDGARRDRVGSTTLSSTYAVAATGDFNGDGLLDILWRAPGAGRVRMWLGNGLGFAGHWVESYNQNWTVEGAGDINGDGKDDILWRYKGDIDKNFRYWLMDGAQRLDVGGTTLSSPYEIVSTGDYNGDGKLDILWRVDGASRLRIWIGNGRTFGGAWITSYNFNWQVLDPDL